VGAETSFADISPQSGNCANSGPPVPIDIEAL